MRESQTRKISYTIIIGDKERDNKEISYRLFGQTKTTTLSQQEFFKHFDNVIEAKKIAE